MDPYWQAKRQAWYNHQFRELYSRYAELMHDINHDPQVARNAYWWEIEKKKNSRTRKSA